MELDTSGFATQGPTVFAGNIGENRYIVQVSPLGIRLLEGGGFPDGGIPGHQPVPELLRLARGVRLSPAGWGLAGSGHPRFLGLVAAAG